MDRAADSSLDYSNHDTTMATTVAALARVASQPITCSERGNVKLATIAGRLVRHIFITMTGTATTPFGTALYYNALIRPMGEKSSAKPTCHDIVSPSA
jgi:uncharacterized membrane protein